MFQAEPLEYYPEEGFLIQLVFQAEPLEYYPEEGFLI
jgi:hypothetical protein